MAITWTSWGRVELINYVSFYFNRPAEVTTGDVMTVFAVVQSGTISTPSGWTLQRSYSNGVTVYLFTRVVTNISTEPSQYTFSASGVYGHALLIGLTGANNTSPVNAVSTGYGDGSSASVSFMNQALTLNGGNRYLTFVGSVGSVSHTWFGSNMAEIIDVSGSYGSISVASDTLEITGSTSTPITTGETSQGTTKATITIGYNHAATDPWPPFLDDPTNDEAVDRASIIRFDWTHQDEVWQPQASATFRYRTVGAGTWTTVAISNANTYYDMPANTLVANTRYEWSVITVNSAGRTSPASSTTTFWARNVPTAPTITAPASLGVVSATATVTWTVTNQDEYRVRVWSDSGFDEPVEPILYDSGATVGSATRSHVASFPVNNTRAWVTVQVKYQGIWSLETYRQVQVTYTAPAAPTSMSLNTRNVGTTPNVYPSALELIFSNPTPSGGQPAVKQAEFWVNEVNFGTGRKIASFGSQGQSNPWNYTWYYPELGRVYYYKVKLLGANGSNYETVWTLANAAASGAGTGIVLQDTMSPTIPCLYIALNDSGASEFLEMESALVDVQGRTYPMLEYGQGKHKTIDIPIIYSEGSTDAYNIQAMMERKTIVCYRDYKGRVEFGRLRQGDIKDRFFGHVTSLQLDVIDYSDGPYFTTAS